MKTQAVETSRGYLRGRDAIYLDRVTHDFSNAYLMFEGQLNNDYGEADRFSQYTLLFFQPTYYTCIELDRYKNEKDLSSSFDIVVDSELLMKTSFSINHQHFILATYDYVYEIIATGYEIK